MSELTEILIIGNDFDEEEVENNINNIHCILIILFLIFVLLLLLLFIVVCACQLFNQGICVDFNKYTNDFILLITVSKNK